MLAWIMLVGKCRLLEREATVNKILAASAFAIAVGLLAAAPASAELIVNGGFETGDFTGWTVASNNTGVESSGFDGYSPHSGSFFAALGNVECCGSMSQTFVDTPGGTLDVNLFLASDGQTPNRFSIELNGATLFDHANISAGGYVHITGSGLATGLDTLTLFSRDDPGWLALDDVSVTERTGVPEPTSLALLTSALVGFGWYWRRRQSA
jgi:hypothetical protein